MKKYFISIVRKSIKANPNAGSMQTVYPGWSTTTLEISLCRKNVNEMVLIGKILADSGDSVLITTPSNFMRVKFALIETTTKFRNTLAKSKITEEKVLKSLLRDIKNVRVVSECSSDEYERMNFSENMNLQTIRHQPEDKWLYKYKDVKVQCSECGKKFSHTKLCQDWNEGPIYRICPYCDTAECCEIEYEDIKDIKGDE